MSQFKKYINLINEMKVNKDLTPSLAKKIREGGKEGKKAEKERIEKIRSLIKKLSPSDYESDNYGDSDYHSYEKIVDEELNKKIHTAFTKYLSTHKLKEKFETFKKMLEKTGSKYDIVTQYIENGTANDLLHIIESLHIMENNTDYEEEIKVYDAENEIKFAFLFQVKVENVRYQIKDIIEELNKIKKIKKYLKLDEFTDNVKAIRIIPFYKKYTDKKITPIWKDIYPVLSDMFPSRNTANNNKAKFTYKKLSPMMKSSALQELSETNNEEIEDSINKYLPVFKIQNIINSK
jgi:hypothetical protein